MGQRDAFRESFRSSFQDAFDGIDVEELQTGDRPRFGMATPRATLPRPGDDGVTPEQLEAAVSRLAARVDSVHLAVQRHREVTDEAIRGLTVRLLTMVGAGFFTLVVVVLLLALLLRR